MAGPLVSIVIPVYNGGNYLREAIDSALAQTYTNIEIVVVNDGSSDNGKTEEIALSYGNKIRYFHKENGGVATALNFAIHVMQGDFFSWLSHDDMYHTNKIEHQIGALEKHGDMTAIIFSSYELLNANTNEITTILHSDVFSEDQLTNSVFPVLQGLIHGCSLLVHKSHFERVGVFDETLITTQDYDLWFRMLRNQKTIYQSESYVIARLHDNQGSRTLACHDAEREELHINFMNELTQNEIINMYRDEYTFYHRMSSFFKGAGMVDSYKYALEKLLVANVPEDTGERLLELQEYISKLSNGKAEKICIFCAGEYGLRLSEELRSRLIKVDFFSDNDPIKWDFTFDNVPCVSPETLEFDKENTLIIVANRAPVGIVNELRFKGFPNITTKQQIDKFLFDVPPIIKINS